MKLLDLIGAMLLGAAIMAVALYGIDSHMATQTSFSER